MIGYLLEMLAWVRRRPHPSQFYKEHADGVWRFNEAAFTDALWKWRTLRPTRQNRR